MLIARGGLDLNAGVCTSPLHLACKLGHAAIVQMLLDGGARADLARRVCYPVAHHLKPAVGARKPARFCISPNAINYVSGFSHRCRSNLHCFDAVGWAAGRASDL